MDEFVPEDIAALIASIEAKQDSDFQARKRAEEAEVARLRKIDDLRQSRREELVAACLAIDAWVRRFEETAAPSIWRLNGGAGIVIFSARFQRGEPMPNDAHASAKLLLGPPGKKAAQRLVYDEQYATSNGTSVHPLPLLSVMYLWQKTHPDFVLRCAAHLSGPDAWKHVRAELERLCPK